MVKYTKVVDFTERQVDESKIHRVMLITSMEEELKSGLMDPN